MGTRSNKYLPIFFVAVVALLLQSCAKNYSGIKLTDSKIESVTATSMRSMKIKVLLTVDNPAKGSFSVENVHGVINRSGEIFADFKSEDIMEITGKSICELPCTIVAELDKSVSVLSAGLILAEGDFDSFTCDIYADIHKGAFKKSVKRKNLPLKSLVRKLKNE